MLRSFSLILLSFIFSFSLYAGEPDFNCRSAFLKEAKVLLQGKHADILSMQLELTTLKLAKMAMTKKQKSLEGLVRKMGKKLKHADKGTLLKLRNLYQRHGKAADLEKILENFKGISYWSPETRFYNQDASMFILSHQLLEQNSPLDENDAAITWLASSLSKSVEEKLGRRGKVYNLSNISTRIARVIEELGSDEKIQARKSKVKKEIAQGWSDLKNDLSEGFKKYCFEELNEAKSCGVDPIMPWLSQAIKTLELDENGKKIRLWDLEEEVNLRFKNKIRFRLRSDLPTLVKNKEKYLKTVRSPWKQNSDTGLVNFEEIRRWQKDLNQLPDELTIKAYKKNGHKNYGVLDKSKNLLTIYSSQGTVLASSEMTFPYGKSDLRFDKSSQSKKGGGAGVYVFKNLSDSKMVLIEDMKGRTSALVAGEKQLECGFKEACREGKNTGSDLIKKYLSPDGELYILPLDQSNQFVVKNGRLQFTTMRDSGNFFGYNFSPKDKRNLPIKFDIRDERYQTEVAKSFMDTLEREKGTLMKLYNLDNDEYNLLAQYAFGVLGNESEFGENWKYDLKEAFPFGVAFSREWKRGVFDKAKNDFKKTKQEEGVWEAVKKGGGTYFKEIIEFDAELLTGKINADRNSRGPTQIKKIPVKIQKHYGFGKDELKDPINAARATLGFLAQSMEELKIKAKKNPDINSDNMMEYLHYIYMGSSHEITNQTATPDKNIYLRKLKEYQKGLSLQQKVISFN